MSSIALILLLSAAPTFDDVVKKFPAATLPLSSTDLGKPKVELSAGELKFLALKEHASGELAIFGLSPLVIRPIASIARAGHTVLVVRAEQLQVTAFFLISYGPKGEFLDAIRFARSSKEVDVTLEELATITAEGSIGRHTITRVAMHDEGVPAELKLTADQPAKLTARGTFESAPSSFGSRDGIYLDAKTHEEFRVFGEDVYFRANETKAFRLLNREGNSIRFKADGPVYSLSWDEKRRVLSCLDLEGNTQLFTRTR